MKRFMMIVVIVLLITLTLSACGGVTKEVEPVATLTPMTTLEPTPTPTPEPASVVLMEVPEAEAANFPIPEAYMPIDPITDYRVPMNIGGFTAYSFEDIDGNVQFRAFGQKLNPADQSFAGEQGWYAFTVEDQPVTADTIKTIAEGERVLALDKETGDIVNTFIVGDTENPIDGTVFEAYNVIHRVVAFDAFTATPVDLEAEAATYAPMPMPTPEHEAQETRQSGRKTSENSNESSSSSNEKAENNGGGSDSSDGEDWSPNPTRPTWDDDTEFEVIIEGKEEDLGNGWIVYY